MDKIVDTLLDIHADIDDKRDKYKEELAHIKRIVDQITRELEPEKHPIILPKRQITEETGWWDILKYPAMAAAVLAVGGYIIPFGLDVRLRYSTDES